MGRKKRPFYRLVAADQRSPRDGRFIEKLGYYDPLTNPHTLNFDDDRIIYWLENGAQPSTTVNNLLRQKGILHRIDMKKRGFDEAKIEVEMKKWELLQVEKRKRTEAAAVQKKTKKEQEKAEAEAKAKAEEEAAAAPPEKPAVEAKDETPVEEPKVEEKVEEEAEAEPATEEPKPEEKNEAAVETEQEEKKEVAEEAESVAETAADETAKSEDDKEKK